LGVVKNPEKGGLWEWVEKRGSRTEYGVGKGTKKGLQKKKRENDLWTRGKTGKKRSWGPGKNKKKKKKQRKRGSITRLAKRQGRGQKKKFSGTRGVQV